MQSETRTNLIFLGVFLVISLPGAVILFNKKLDPDARIGYLPPTVRQSTPYNNPQETAPHVLRTQPPVTMGWVTGVSADVVGVPPMRLPAAGGREVPLVSDGRRLEVLASEPGRLWVLAWVREFGTGTVDDASAAVTAGGEQYDARVWPHPVGVPHEVVLELKNGGFVQPPTRAAVLRIEWPGDVVAESVTLRWSTRGREGEDVLRLPDAHFVADVP